MRKVTIKGLLAHKLRLALTALAIVRGVPGVQAAEGQITGYAQFVAHDGKAISTGGAPTLAVAFDPDQQISPLHLIAGGPPVTADDVVMDAGTAQKYHFSVGQTVRILSAGPPRTFTITGITEFGTANNLAGATLAAFTLPTAQAITQSVGKLDAI